MDPFRASTEEALVLTRRPARELTEERASLREDDEQGAIIERGGDGRRDRESKAEREGEKTRMEERPSGGYRFDDSGLALFHPPYSISNSSPPWRRRQLPPPWSCAPPRVFQQSSGDLRARERAYLTTHTSRLLGKPTRRSPLQLLHLLCTAWRRRRRRRRRRNRETKGRKRRRGRVRLRLPLPLQTTTKKIKAETTRRTSLTTSRSTARSSPCEVETAGGGRSERKKRGMSSETSSTSLVGT